MPKSAPAEVEVPGAPSNGASAEPQTTQAAEPTAQPDDNSAAAIAARDAEIAQLRAQLAQSQGAGPEANLMVPANGPNERRYRAESKHIHLTSAELDKQVRSGKLKLTDHHVLCKDGWYVNPLMDRDADTTKR